MYLVKLLLLIVSYRINLASDSGAIPKWGKRERKMKVDLMVMYYPAKHTPEGYRANYREVIPLNDCIVDWQQWTGGIIKTKDTATGKESIRGEVFDDGFHFIYRHYTRFKDCGYTDYRHSTVKSLLKQLTR